MLTLFAIPKAFEGHIGIIQRNAIKSWMRLQPQPEIILLGDDAGTAEVAQEFGLIHCPDIARNEYGTPLLSSLFDRARTIGSGSVFAYVNADIILLSDFAAAVKRVALSRFMVTGQRWNLDQETSITFDAEWETKLRDRIRQFGHLEGPQAMDYFIFTRDTYKTIPPFAIGRTAWDNWLLCEAFRRYAMVIDATEAITAVHQNHAYTQHPQGREWIWQGPETQENLKLLGGRHYAYFMLDLADRCLTPQGLYSPRWSWQRLERRLDMMPLARPQFKPLAAPLLHLVRQRSHVSPFVAKVRKIPQKIFGH